MICVTYVPSGVTGSPSLCSQELLGQYWCKNDPVLHHCSFCLDWGFFQEKIQLILSEVMKLLQVGRDALALTSESFINEM